MGLRPAKTFRELDRPPWTRYSRINRLNFVKARPHKHLVRFIMGEYSRLSEFPIAVHLVAKDSYRHRDNALEAARKTANKLLEKMLPKRYVLLVRKYPHDIIRENKMVVGAGADRIQQGMRRAFGKPVSNAARVYEGDKVMTVYVMSEKDVSIAKEALRRASKKLSGRFKIVPSASEHYHP